MERTASNSYLSDKELQSTVIDLLRFPLMIGVVIIHSRLTPRFYPQLADITMINWGGYDYVSWLFSKVLCGLCVPMFFLFSGYYFFNKGTLTLDLYIDKLKKRFNSIVIPFVLWNIIYTLIYSFIGYNIYHNEIGKAIGIVPWENAITGTLLKDTYYWIVGVFVNFNNSASPVDVPFWYMRDLIYMFILAPLVYFYAKWLKIIGIVLLTLLWVMTGQLDIFPSFVEIINIRPAVLFFVIGACFSINKMNMVSVITSIGSWVYWLYAIVAVLDLLTKDMTFNCYLHRVTILIGIIVVFKFGLKAVLHMAQKPEIPFINKVRETNFFIYAFHWILLYWLSFPLSKIVAWGSDWALVTVYLLQIILSCIVSIAIGLLLNRYCPKFMRVLNGR